MNLIKSHLAKQLDMHGASQKFAVKRNNQYLCQANDTFKFLNISTYLSPGVSYTQFLKAFDVVEQKGFSRTNGSTESRNWTI
jgi:hypothetical protein